MAGDDYESKKVVWILGSGFSKALGGPLLADLLSHRGRGYTRAKFPNINSDQVYQLFWSHLRGGLRNAFPLYWDHAEEFLDFISPSGFEESPRKSVLEDALRNNGAGAITDWDEFAVNALRCVAAECLFTSHANPESEAWKPYKRWVERLNKNHTIVTFNYDLVLELLGHKRPRVKVGIESVVNPSLDNMHLIRGMDVVPILKLHGSVNWHEIEGTFGKAEVEHAAQCLKDDMIPMLATPGPEKLSQSNGAMKKLWDTAAAAIAEAEVIVFLGYRFPPSDSHAVQELMGAIRRISINQYVRLHTVLGPNVKHEHSVRLLNLLAHTLEDAGRSLCPSPSQIRGTGGQFHIFQHPLYVEDFLSVFHSKLLYGRLLS